MFTVSVRVGNGFPVLLGESAEYQICLMFHQSTLTLDPDTGFAH